MQYFISLGISGIHFKVGYFGGPLLNGTPKTQMAILLFLYCGEFVKTSNVLFHQMVFPIASSLLDF